MHSENRLQSEKIYDVDSNGFDCESQFSAKNVRIKK